MTLVHQPHGEVAPVMPAHAIQELVHPTSIPFVGVTPAAASQVEVSRAAVPAPVAEAGTTLPAADLRAVEILTAALRVRPEGRPAAYRYADQTSVSVGVAAAQLAGVNIWRTGA